MVRPGHSYSSSSFSPASQLHPQQELRRGLMMLRAIQFSLWKTRIVGSRGGWGGSEEVWSPLLAPRLRGRRARRLGRALALVRVVVVLVGHVVLRWEFVLGVRLLAVHVGQLLEPGPEVVQVLELEVRVGVPGVERGERPVAVAVALVRVVAEVVVRRRVGVAVDAVLEKRSIKTSVKATTSSSFLPLLL